MNENKDTKPKTEAEKFVDALMKNDNVKAGKHLEEMLKNKVAHRIKETLI